MGNTTRKRYDIIEYVKEISPEMDLDKVNIAEAILEREQIRELVARDKETFSPEELEVVCFLEGLLESLDMEPGEVIEEAEIANMDDIEVDIGIADIAIDDLIDFIDGIPTGEFHNTDYAALLEQIRGCKASEYEAKCKESEKAWAKAKATKTSRAREVDMDKGR